MRKNELLAVVRCGDSSLHESWSRGERKWHLGLSYFGNNDSLTFSHPEYLHRHKGGKWEGIFEFFKRFPEALDRYTYFWFPDDDISAKPDDVNRMIDLMARHKLMLAQPSLDCRSYWSHLLTMQNPNFDIRFVNFVEIMAPLMEARIVKTVLPTFDGNMSGFGFEYLWNNIVRDNDGKSAIFDNISVRHTRPVGGALHKMIAGQSSDAMLEFERFLRYHNISGRGRIGPLSIPRIRCTGGTLTGRKIKASKLRFVASLITGYLGIRPLMVQKVSVGAILKLGLKSFASE